MVVSGGVVCEGFWMVVAVSGNESWRSLVALRRLMTPRRLLRPRRVLMLLLPQLPLLQLLPLLLLPLRQH